MARIRPERKVRPRYSPRWRRDLRRGVKVLGVGWWLLRRLSRAVSKHDEVIGTVSVRRGQSVAVSVLDASQRRRRRRG
jgi:hypothetical protein